MSTGEDRIENANQLADELINAGHSDAPDISNWKESINTSWLDLIELIDTRVLVSFAELLSLLMISDWFQHLYSTLYVL